jgi:diguanylate cyclase (GGDEF)-like protein
MRSIGSKVAGAVRQHPWSSAQDAALLSSVLLVGLLLALEYDIALFWDDLDSNQRRLRFEELLILTGLLGLGVFVFILRRMQEERGNLEARLSAEIELRESRALAMQDPLTSLPNRRAIRADLDAAIERESAGGALAFYLLDLNGFKRVNDEHGHASGDAVLQAVAQRFRAAARAGDTIARLGGDEFAVLAPGVSSRGEATQIGQRFVDAMADGISVGNGSFAVGVAVGVAFFPADGSTADELIHHADLAMYRAKATERSELRFFEPATRRAAVVNG